ncbi:MAG: hypothetical protein Q9209_005234 [Squamulea sp. 1 TL-2023]
MICHRCLRLNIHLRVPQRNRLSYSTSRSPNPARSTSAAQPFSTPFTPSPYPSNSPTHPPKPKSPSSPLPTSSLKAGTPLKGLAFEKNKEPPVAREDGEYPEWLWGLLNTGKGEEDKGIRGGGDAFSKSAKQRRIAARAARQGSSSSSILGNHTLAPEIPIHEQSIDLPASSEGYKGRKADVEGERRAREVREELTRSLRGKRRKGIKEGNFLRGMR